MIKQKLVLLFLAVLLAGQGVAQTVDFTGLKSISLKNMRAMRLNNEVHGYYAFFLVDREDRKNNLYQLRIFDVNLQETHSVEMIKPVTSRLIEGEFNGSHFCFFFADLKKATQELMLMDLEGTETGSYLLDEKREFLTASASDDSPATQSLIAVENKGFAVVKYDRNKGYKTSIIHIDNTGKVLWETPYASPEEKSFDGQACLYSNDQFILSTVTTRRKMMSTKGANTFLKIYSLVDGTEMAEIKLNAGKHFLSPFGANYDDKTSEILIYGEYYGRNGKGTIDIKNKLGFFINRYSTSGDLMGEGYASWEDDIKPVIPFDPEDKKAARRSLIVHQVIRTANGKYYAIAEQYAKAVSGGGVALNALSGALGGGQAVSNIQINLFDMMIFEFSADLKVENVQIIEKKKTKIPLAPGYGTVQKDKLGYLMKMMGYFDYSFTSVNSSKTNFNCVYVNYDRKTDGKNKNTIGNITLDDQGKVQTVKVLPKSKPTSFIALPAKPGYIAVFEYFRKTKSAALRLVKLDI
jgi:hypothetical protein